MSKVLLALIVEDSLADTELVVKELRRGGYEVAYERVDTAEALKSTLARGPWNIVFCDFTLPRFSGQMALRLIQESGLDLPFIYVSGTIGEDAAVEAMKAGAHDYVMKNNLKRLVPAVDRELRDARGRRQCRLAEEALRASEHKYREVFKNLSDAAFLIDEATGKIIDTNLQAEVLLGRSRGEILGLNQRLLYSPPQTGQRPPFSLGDGSRSSPGGCELEVRRKDETLVPAHVCSSRLELYGRRLWLALFRDMTEHRGLEAALRRQEAHFRALIENAMDVILVLGADGTIQYQSPSVERVLGYKPEELVGKNPFDFVHPQDQSRIYAVFSARATSPGSTATEELRFRHRDGTWRSLEIVGKNLVDNPDVRGVVLNSRDITSRKQMEKERERLTRDRLLILESITEGIYGIDLQGCCTFINPSAAKMLAYRPTKSSARRCMA